MTEIADYPKPWGIWFNGTLANVSAANGKSVPWEVVHAELNRSNGPKSEPLVKAWNESVQRGLKHEFFQDGLAADTYELQPWQAYAEGWRDAWLESADDLSNATKDGKP